VEAPDGYKSSGVETATSLVDSIESLQNERSQSWEMYGKE